MKPAEFKEFMENLDPALGNVKRYLIVSALVLFDPLTVGRLAKILGLPYGDLDTHLRKLKSCGYIKTRKVITDAGPRTLVELTEKGFENYMKFTQKLYALSEKVIKRTQN